MCGNASLIVFGLASPDRDGGDLRPRDLAELLRSDQAPSKAVLSGFVAPVL
jgi:hypothetical protein